MFYKIFIFGIFFFSGLYTSNLTRDYAFYDQNVSFNDTAQANHKSVGKKNNSEFDCGYIYCCPNGLRHAAGLVTSFSIFLIEFVKLTRSRQVAGSIQYGYDIAAYKPLALSAFCFSLPYILRYLRTDDLIPHCYHTAFFSPTLFIEVPYVFYQRNKVKKALKQDLS